MSGAVRVSWRQDAEVRTSSRQRALGAQWPTVEQPSQDEEEVLLWSKEQLGSILLSVLVSTHFSHTTNITLSKIKCERFIFYKEVCSFVIEVVRNRLIVSAYICICIRTLVCGYTKCCRSKEKIKIYFKIGRSTKRFVFFEFSYFVLTYVLYMCMFPACCFT